MAEAGTDGPRDQGDDAGPGTAQATPSASA